MTELIATNSGLRAFFGAGLAPLCEHLVDRIRTRPLPPRDNEIVVVQSQGMRQWLELKFADAFSVAGSLAMPFSGSLGKEIAAWLGMPAPERDAFSREALTWRIDSLLGELNAADKNYAALAPYLAVSDDRMRFGLAARIAGRFDDYQLFRTELIEAWEAGEPGSDSPHAVWQAALWRTLCTGAGDHRARQIATVLERLRSAAPGSLARIPQRISVRSAGTSATNATRRRGGAGHGHKFASRPAGHAPGNAA
jgi:exodeoxyribonuclease V gamma subunit